MGKLKYAQNCLVQSHTQALNEYIFNEYTFYFIDFFLYKYCIIKVFKNFLSKAIKHPHLLHNLHNQKSSKGP